MNASLGSVSCSQVGGSMEWTRWSHGFLSGPEGLLSLSPSASGPAMGPAAAAATAAAWAITVAAGAAVTGTVSTAVVVSVGGRAALVREGKGPGAAAATAVAWAATVTAGAAVTVSVSIAAVVTVGSRAAWAVREGEGPVEIGSSPNKLSQNSSVVRRASSISWLVSAGSGTGVMLRRGDRLLEEG